MYLRNVPLLARKIKKTGSMLAHDYMTEVSTTCPYKVKMLYSFCKSTTMTFCYCARKLY